MGPFSNDSSGHEWSSGLFSPPNFTIMCSVGSEEVPQSPIISWVWHFHLDMFIKAGWPDKCCISIKELQPLNNAPLQSESVAGAKSQTNPARPLQTRKCGLEGHKTNGAFRHSLTTPKVDWKLIKPSYQKVHLVAVLVAGVYHTIFFSRQSYPIVDIHISIPVLST